MSSISYDKQSRAIILNHKCAPEYNFAQRGHLTGLLLDYTICKKHIVERDRHEQKNRNSDSQMTPICFYIYLSLAEEGRHGYAILQEVETISGGAMRLNPGTLYRSIKRMLDDGFIIESTAKRPADDDERRRYYKLTAQGRRVGRDEAHRLSMLVEIARQKRELPSSPNSLGTIQ